MAVFVHIAPESEQKRIEKNGIKPSEEKLPWPAGVYCMPVLPNYFLSHQWLRELKRGGQRNFCAVRFRVGSDEKVWVAHFNKEPVEVTAGEAAKLVLEAADARGYQIVIARKILPKEIVGFATVNRLVGWRYSPDLKGTAPSCACRACIPKGEIKGRRLKNALGGEDAPGKKPSGRKLLAQLASSLDEAGTLKLLTQLAALPRRNGKELAFLLASPSEALLRAVAENLAFYSDADSKTLLERLAKSKFASVRKTAKESLAQRLLDERTPS